MKYTCPVCGWPELHQPARDESNIPSFEICPCCCFQPGYDDDSQGLTYEQARARWIAGGMKWWSASQPAPVEWSGSRQLARAGLK